jgi:hypothetical protein
MIVSRTAWKLADIGRIWRQAILGTTVGILADLQVPHPEVLQFLSAPGVLSLFSTTMMYEPIQSIIPATDLCDHSVISG